MLNYIKSFFNLEPPFKRWIDYNVYQDNWREIWHDKVKIIEYDKKRHRIKLAKLSMREIFEADIRDNL